MNYQNRKVFQPRLANDKVWEFFVKQLDFENHSNDANFFEWSFVDVLDDEELSTGSKWLVDNRASIFETVLLDMR